MFLEKSGLQYTSGSIIKYLKCLSNALTTAEQSVTQTHTNVFDFSSKTVSQKARRGLHPAFKGTGSGVHLLQVCERTPYMVALQSFALTLFFPLFFMAFLHVCPLMCMCVCMYLNVEARGHPQALSLGCLAWNSLCGLGSLATELPGSAYLCVPSTGIRSMGNAWLLPFAQVLGMVSVH